jgi:ribosome-associated protein
VATIKFDMRGDFIQLDQLLKVTDLVASGGEAHVEVAAGMVKVDGEVELRKRAKLRPGQRVEYNGEVVELGSREPAKKPENKP